MRLTQIRWRWAARPTPKNNPPRPRTNLDAGANEEPADCWELEHRQSTTVAQPDNSTRRRAIGWASAVLGGLIAGLLTVGGLIEAVQAISEAVGTLF